MRSKCSRTSPRSASPIFFEGLEHAFPRSTIPRLHCNSDLLHTISMPHKHKRKRDDDKSNYDLPPTSRAKTLSVHRKSESIFTSDAEKKRKLEAKKQRKDQKKQEYNDDTPKAFQRLMAFQQEGKRIRSGLDDGTKPSKKKSKPTTKIPENKTVPSEDTLLPPTNPAPTVEIPKIKPGESLSTFSQRVDQSLPLASIPKHSTRLSTASGLEKLKTPLTKHNKKLARMQKDWREQDRRYKERKEEEDEEMAEKREEDELVWLSAGLDPNKPLSSARGKKRKKGGAAGRDIDDVDPWKVLEKKRREEGELKQRNLQDVVQAPPVLKPLKNIFKERDGAVPRTILT